jgi:hypothetical protein
MGNYADFYIENLHASSSKNGVDPDLISFFNESDLQVYQSTDLEFDQRAAFWTPEDAGVGEPFKVVYLTAPVSRVRTIFDVHGYTLNACIRNFESCLKLKAAKTDTTKRYEHHHR